MKLCYVSGAYRAPTINGVYQNIQAARAVAGACWVRGFATICPHMNTAFMDGLAPDAVWLDGDLEMVRRCDLVVVVPGWEQSQGTRAEIAEAQAHGIPVHSFPDVPHPDTIVARR